MTTFRSDSQSEAEEKRARLTKLKNIGPKCAAWMIEVGVDSPERLEEIGAVETYLRIRSARPRQINLVALWALHGALTGVPYNRIDPDEKEALKQAIERLEEGR